MLLYRLLITLGRPVVNKREVVEGPRKKHEPISPAGLVRPLPGGRWYPSDGSLVVGVPLAQAHVKLK
jgi:hypothetical protein